MFLFQKDEAELLPSWARYHARLFGNANIHIIDGNSTHPVITQQLNVLKSAGVHILAASNPFKQKAAMMTELMQEIADKDQHSFLVPLDADEFIIGLPEISKSCDTSFTYNKSLILKAFAELPTDGRKYKLPFVQARICDSSDHSKQRPHMAKHFLGPFIHCHSKTYYASEYFDSVDQGNHIGKVIMDRHCSTTEQADTKSCVISFLADSGRIDKLVKTSSIEGSREDSMDSFAGVSPGDLEICTPFYHSHQLGIIHYDGPGMPFGSYVKKMLRGATVYNYVSNIRSNDTCYGMGEHYCKFYQAYLLNDTETMERMHANTWLEQYELLTLKGSCPTPADNTCSGWKYHEWLDKET